MRAPCSCSTTGATSRRVRALSTVVGISRDATRVASSSARSAGEFLSGMPWTFTGGCAGSWFGEGTIFKREARRYDVIALQETHVACVPSAAFNRLLQTSFEFNRFVIELLNERCGQFIGRFIGQAMLNADAQVARSLAGLFHPRLYPRMDAHLKISQ